MENLPSAATTTAGTVVQTLAMFPLLSPARTHGRVAVFLLVSTSAIVFDVASSQPRKQLWQLSTEEADFEAKQALDGWMRERDSFLFYSPSLYLRGKNFNC
jgi:hypothetical protein